MSRSFLYCLVRGKATVANSAKNKSVDFVFLWVRNGLGISGVERLQRYDRSDSLVICISISAVVAVVVELHFALVVF